MGRPDGRVSSSSFPLPGAPDLSLVVAEVIQRIASPEKTEEIVADALRRAKRETMPQSGRAILAFVSGALFEAVAEHLGDDAGEHVMADLGPMLDRAIDYERSGTHRRTHDDPTTPRASGEGIATRPVVVVADDDELIRRALERALSARGFDVYTADSGDMALSMCLRHQPHVLVTDHHMPGLTGVEVAQMARRSMGGAAPAVILLTGADVRPAPGAVARRLQKPVTLDALVAEIQAVLGEETLARSSAAPTGTSRPR